MVDRGMPRRLGAEPLGQETNAPMPAMAVHRQAVERTERPGVRALDAGPIAKRGPEPDECFLNGVVSLVG